VETTFREGPGSPTMSPTSRGGGIAAAPSWATSTHVFDPVQPGETVLWRV
jgi:hypothetical protein